MQFSLIKKASIVNHVLSEQVIIINIDIRF